MEAHQLLTAWLNSRQNYAEGLALAKAHGIGGVQLHLLESGQNKFTAKKLREGIQGLLDQLRVQATAPASVAPVPAAVLEQSPAPEPPELLELRKRRTATFKQAQHHHGQMRLAPSGSPERKQHAQRIKQLFRENTQLWEQEAYYQKFGFLPVPAKPTIDLRDLVAVTARRNTLRTYLSSAKTGSRAKTNPEKVATWAAELLELNLVLAHG